MPFMIGIGENTNLLLTLVPMILLSFSGYTIGSLTFKIFFKKDPNFMKALIYGNVILNFLFVSGIIFFGLLTQLINEFFIFFSYMLIGLSFLGVSLLLRRLIKSILSVVGNKYLNEKIKNMRLSLVSFYHERQTNIFILFGVAFFVTMLGYQCLIIYLHPIFSEYDSIYLFLPVSKSLLLGNGLNHDFYLGSDVNMRFAPFVQAINAWLMHSFEYSSIRIFPFYFVFFSAIILYYLTRNILETSSSRKDASFFGFIASSVFLITPAILVTASRFSLQQDLAFIFFLTASFYFLSEILRNDKPGKFNLMSLAISLALMSLTREVGLVMSIAIFFLVPAIKYTEGNLKLRLLFTILSLLPFYVYYAVFYGPIPTNTGLIVTLVANLGIFFIVSRLKNQIKFSSLIGSASNFICIIPLVVPLIFITTNIMAFNGLYPSVSISDKYYETVSLQMDAFAQVNMTSQFVDTIVGLPRLDVLFISIAMGSIFVIFKLIGFGKIFYGLHHSNQYSIILLLMIVLLITWSSLLQSGFKTSSVRHVAYFVPLLSIVFVIGLKKNGESPFYWKLFCCAVIVISSVYFLSFNLHAVHIDSIFSGFAIDPYNDPFITTTDLGLGIILGIPLLITGVLKLIKSSRNERETKLSKYVMAFAITFLIGLIVLQVHTVTTTQIALIPTNDLDTRAPPGWEFHVFDVINFLNGSESGNVLAMRAPGIPFFTNRTSYDFFNQQAFAYDISDIILSKNSTHLKQRFLDLQIKYIVIPNEESSLYYSVQHLVKGSKFLEMVDTDDEFEKIKFKEFNVYKYNPGHANVLDLIDKNHIWKAVGKTDVIQNSNNLRIRVDTEEKGKAYNRAILKTELNLASKPIILSLNYEPELGVGNVTYFLEIRDNNRRILFGSVLSGLSGSSTNETYILPNNIVGKPLEFRLYMITQGKGHHLLNVGKLSIFYA